MKLTFSRRELQDLLKAWVAISVAFAIVFSGGFVGFFNLDASFFTMLAISAVTVGTGFLLHELAHKVVAVRYGCWAEFRSFDRMLGLAVIMSLFGFIFAAPGAVFFRHGAAHISLRRQGHIAAAGPITNIVLVVAFATLALVTVEGGLRSLCLFGAQINGLLAVFNMIPFLGLDGAKIWRWDKTAWGIIVGVGAIALLGSGTL